MTGEEIKGVKLTRLGRRVYSDSITRMQDPWGRLYLVQWFPPGGERGDGGGIVLLCTGPNGVSDTSAESMAAGQAAGDDAVVVVTRRL